MRRNIIVLLAIAVLMCGAAVQTKAEPLIAVTTNNVLVSFDSTTPGAFITTPVTGLGGYVLTSLDYRPTDGLLYGLASNATATDARIYTINPLTGVAAFLSTLTPARSLGTPEMDFNPVADTAGLPSLRVVNNTGQNLRVNVETGAVIVDGTITGTPSPRITGVAYTNNFEGATSTTLYAVDAASNRLLRFIDPNAGTFVDVGSLGNAVIGSATGFDISGATGIAYVATTRIENPSMLYTINLATGQTTLVGQIGTGSLILGLTVVPTGSAAIPEPATMVLLGTGLLGVGAAVRKRHKSAK